MSVNRVGRCEIEKKVADRRVKRRKKGVVGGVMTTIAIVTGDGDCISSKSAARFWLKRLPASMGE